MPSRTEKLAERMLKQRGERIIVGPSEKNHIDIQTDMGFYEVKSVDARRQVGMMRYDKVSFKLKQLIEMLNKRATVMVMDRVTEKLILEFKVIPIKRFREIEEGIEHVE